MIIAEHIGKRKRKLKSIKDKGNELILRE